MKVDKTYFEKDFIIIPEHDASELWKDGDRSFLVLSADGTDRYADNYYSFEDVLKDADWFGLEME